MMPSSAPSHQDLYLVQLRKCGAVVSGWSHHHVLVNDPLHSVGQPVGVDPILSFVTSLLSHLIVPATLCRSDLPSVCIRSTAIRYKHTGPRSRARTSHVRSSLADVP